MSEVKREFWLIEYDSDTTQVWKDECPPEHEDEAVHVVSMDWHEQEMERVKKQLREYEHECETVQEMQSQVKSLTAMLDKMEKALVDGDQYNRSMVLKELALFRGSK